MKTFTRLTWKVALRWLIGVVLVWAALGKLVDPHAFHTSLLAYRLPLPGALTAGVAIVLPWLELLCGLLLLADHRTPAVLAWALVLFGVFTVCTGQIRSLYSRRTRNCGAAPAAISLRSGSRWNAGLRVSSRQPIP